MRPRIFLGSVVVLSVLFVWQSPKPSIASFKVVEPQDMDITHDGNVDAVDLIALLGGWGLRELPTPTPPTHPFEGGYQGTFGGPLSGSVTLLVDPMGNVDGSATSGSDVIDVLGAISSDGHFYGNEIEGNDTILATVIGTFSGDHGSGRWVNDEGQSGTWMATRVP